MLMDRQFWIAHKELTARPIVMASRRLTPQLLKHLLESKTKNAVKQKIGHQITPMQAVCSNLVVPLVFPCWIDGMPNYRNGKHVIERLQPDEPPMVVLSALVHPDFEFDNVAMKAIQLGSEPIEGKNSLLSLGVNDDELKMQLVYQSTHSHKSPSRKTAITGRDFINVNNKVLSLEMLRNIVKTQLNLEQRGLQEIAESFNINFVYTWDPPAIFAREIGYEILDNLFYEAVVTEGLLCDRITTSAFNDFQNKNILPRSQDALPHVHITSKSMLPPSKPREIKVSHNNGDAFANHILTQPVSTSLDGAIGSISSAAASLCFRKPIIKWV